MPVRSVHLPAPLVLVPGKDLLAKLATVKRPGFPTSPYAIQRDLNEVNALGGVPGTLHKPWRAGADWSLVVYTRRYAVRLFATKRGDAYTIASAAPLRLTDHQQLASACLLLCPSGWQVALANRDIPQGVVPHWQLIAAEWTSLLNSLTVTAAADGRQAAFLDTVDRVIDAARQLKARDSGGDRYPYRQAVSAADAWAGTRQRYDFTLAGTRPLENGARVLVAPIAPGTQDAQDDAPVSAPGARSPAARGRA